MVISRRSMMMRGKLVNSQLVLTFWPHIDVTMVLQVSDEGVMVVSIVALCLYICHTFNSAVVVLAAGPVELQERTRRQESIQNSSWVKDGSSLTKTRDMSEVQVDMLNLFHVASAQF